MSRSIWRSIAARIALSCCAAFVLEACYVQAGPTLGRAIHLDADDRTVWGGNIAAGIDDPLHVAVELDGRSEHKRGSALNAGLQLGYTLFGVGSPVRLSLHVDGGFPLAWSARDSWYAGGTAELPIRLVSLAPTSEANRNFRVVGGLPWLVPYLRYRFHPEARASDGAAHDAIVGAALRMHFTSDFL